jgi:hypothetical protein
MFAADAVAVAKEKNRGVSLENRKRNRRALREEDGYAEDQRDRIL